MGITKKILSLISIFGLLFLQITPSFAYVNNGNTTYGYSDYNFYYITDEYKTGADQYLNAFFKKISNLSTDQQITTLKKVKIKVDIIRAKFEKQSNGENNVILLSYISKSIVDKLNELEATSLVEEKTENINIDDEEIRYVEGEIIKAQSIFYNKIEDYANLMEEELANAYNNSKTGNYNINFKADSEGYGDAEYNLSLNNYESIFNFPNQSITGELKLNGEYNSTYTGTGNTDFSALIDYINSNGNLFLALKDIEYNISDSDLLSEVETFLEDFKDGKYVKLTDEADLDEEIYSFYNNLSLNDVLDPIKTTLEKPMFTPYKAEGNKYYLIPSRDFCNEAIKQSNSFVAKILGTNSNSECTDLSYSKLVSDFSKYADVYLETGEEENTFGIDYLDDENKKLEFELAYNKYVNNLKFVLTETDETETLNLDYERNNNLDLVIDGGEEFSFNFNSTIDDGEFKEINSNLKVDSDYLKLNGELTYSDGELNGTMLGNTYSYNYNSYYDETAEKYTQNGKIDFNINGTLDQFESSLNYENYDYFTYTQDINYNNGIGVFDLGLKADIDYSGELSEIFNYNGEFSIDGKNVTLDSDYSLNILSYNSNGELNITNTEDENSGEGHLELTINSNDLVNVELTIDYDFKNSDKVKEITEPTEYNEYSYINNQEKLANDSNRLYYLDNIKSGLEMYYQDNGEYPSYENFFDVEGYIYYIGTDPYDREKKESCTFGYRYGVSNDGQSYKIANCLESKSNKNKMENDGGNDDNLYEEGSGMENITEIKFIEDIYEEIYSDEYDYSEYK